MKKNFKHGFLKSLLGLLICDPVSSAPLPTAGSPVPRRVVLVHGFRDTGKRFQKIQQRLEACGMEVYAPDMTPNDARCGLEALARQLQKDINAKFGTEQPIFLISYSMGGLVSRYYLQNLGGAARCQQFITISSPHHGTLTAWFYPTCGAAQMRPGSSFLQELAQTETQLGKIPITSYRTPLDLMILPAASSIWQRAENLKYPILAHPLMLRSSRVLEDIELRLQH